MKLIVGLGNPGLEYVGTRHNVGFYFVETMAGEEGWNKWGKSLVKRDSGVIYVKPQTFMNRSGEAVIELMNFYKVDIADLWVIHDDLDLWLGEYKVQIGVGPKGHNGVLSIETSLGNKDFGRVRIGVDNRDDSDRTKGEDYVLKRFDDAEKKVVEEEKSKIINEFKLNSGI